MKTIGFQLCYHLQHLYELMKEDALKVSVEGPGGRKAPRLLVQLYYLLEIAWIAIAHRKTNAPIPFRRIDGVHQ